MTSMAPPLSRARRFDRSPMACASVRMTRDSSGPPCFVARPSSVVRCCALTALPFDARAMVLLRDFVKLSYDELADVVDVAPRKLVHALDRSRAELGEIYDYIKF